MAKDKTHFLCIECQTVHLRWSGKCIGCGEWNTLVETQAVDVRTSKAKRVEASSGRTIVSDSLSLMATYGDPEFVSTGSFEFDRALGGGVIPGSVTLIGGEPGIGKSTLLSQFLTNAAQNRHKCLYVSAEESESQVAGRMARVGNPGASVGILTSNSVDEIEDQIRRYGPKIVVIDSIQTISDLEIGSMAGSVSQVRECAGRLSDLAKAEGISLVFVGHVTKDGNLAGPRVLEHLVDTVAYFEGDRDSILRVLRVIKHRFGPVGDLGMFEMRQNGLVDLENATGIHLLDRVEGQPGSIVFPAVDGRRVMLTEIQALVVSTSAELPRRVVTGLELNRVLLLLAVLEKKLGVRLNNKDVFLSVAGGVKLADPGADLAVVAAVMSSLLDRAVDPFLIFLGEVGLGGEIRSASAAKQRLMEASRMGFSQGIIGPNFLDEIEGMSVRRAKDLIAALSGASLSIR